MEAICHGYEYSMVILGRQEKEFIKNLEILGEIYEK